MSLAQYSSNFILIKMMQIIKVKKSGSHKFGTRRNNHTTPAFYYKDSEHRPDIKSDKVCFFAEDTKILKLIEKIEDINILQEGIYKLFSRAVINNTPLNNDKFKLLKTNSVYSKKKLQSDKQYKNQTGRIGKRFWFYHDTRNTLY